MPGTDIPYTTNLPLARAVENDVLLVHTGHVARTLANGPAAGAGSIPPQAGLSAACLPYLRERDIAALGSDAIQDVQPSGFDSFDLLRPVHNVALVALGLCLLSVGFILTYATTAGLVHF